MADPTNAVRKHRMREARKAKDLKELRVWLSPSTIQRLDALVQKAGRPRSEVLSMIIFNEANQ